MAGVKEDGEAHTLGILKELRDLAEEIGDGHKDYAHRFHKLLQKVHNPNLPDVAKDFGFSVVSTKPEIGGVARSCLRKHFGGHRGVGMRQQDISE